MKPSTKSYPEYWAIRVRYRVGNETPTEQRIRRNAERAKLRDHGFNENTRIQFMSTEPERMVEQYKKQAEAIAAMMTEKSGVKLEVTRGSFL